MFCLVSQKAKEQPHTPAIHLPNTFISYLALDRLIGEKAAEFKSQGMKELYIPARKDVETILSFFACLRLDIPCFLYHEKVLFPKSPLPLKGFSLFLRTSGSAGLPKIAVLNFEQLYASALGILETLSFSEKDIWELSLPLYHIGGIGIVFRTFLKGAALSLLSGLQPTYISLVPTQLFRLLNEKEVSFPKNILLGGAPLENIQQRAEQKGLNIIPTYGMTEMASSITFSGRLLPYRSLKLSKEGEILVKGKTLFQGYLHQEKVSVSLDEGWFATGDLGAFTSTGTLSILGRKDRLFISGGENIHPEEIESALLNLPGITKAFVKSIPDDEYGARPIAYIEEQDASYTVRELQKNLNKFLPSFKVPIQIFPMWKYVDNPPFLGDANKNFL